MRHPCAASVLRKARGGVGTALRINVSRKPREAGPASVFRKDLPSADIVRAHMQRNYVDASATMWSP